MTWEDFLAAHAWHVPLMAALLACSAVFSGTETALFSLTRGQLARLRHAGGAGRLTAFLMRRPGRVLNTLLLGNMLVNVAYASLSAVIVFRLRQGGAAAWTTALATAAPLALLILLGEVSPKMLALVAGDRWALALAAPLAVLQRLFSPVLWVLETALVAPVVRLISPRRPPRSDITAEELAAVLDLSARRGMLDHDANALLQEIMELTDLRVVDVMVPRVDVIACDVDSPPEQVLEVFRRTHLRKIPVYQGDIDHTLGVVHAKRLFLQSGSALRDLVVKVPFVPEAANLEKVMLHFRATRTQMAIVVDEYGGTAGLVTLQDILEEIVGDLPDPFASAPSPPAVQRLGEREYLIDGNLAIHDWEDAFKTDLGGGRISTIGGFVLSLLGHIPQPGETAEYRNLSFTVESMRGRRVGTLRLRLKEEA